MQNERNIDQLSNYLSLNIQNKKHINPQLDSNNDSSDYYEHKSLKRKIVVIVGAGASTEVKLLTADQTTDYVSKYISNKSYLGAAVYESEIERIRRRIENDPTFETKMQAFCKYSFLREKITDLLAQQFSYRPQPVLSYEILAHLFKYGAVDVIINFNFDEQLDRAIEDDMKDYQYVKIIQDGDYKLNEEDIKRYLKPLYIKPHGTVSYPSTIRFTREDYFEITKPVELSIQESIKDAVIFIIVGFAMESVEFRKMFVNRICEKMPEAIFYFTRHSGNGEIKFKEIFTAAKNIKPEEKDGTNLCRYEDKLIDIQTESTDSGLSSLFERIFDGVVEDLKKSKKIDRENDNGNNSIIHKIDYLIPNIDKHKCIHKIFSINMNELEKLTKEKFINENGTGIDIKNTDIKLIKYILPDYYYIRLLFELIFLSSINKGRINLVLIKNSVAGKYYKHYLKTIWQDYYETKKNKEISYPIKHYQHLSTICHNLRFKRPTNSFGIYEEVKAGSSTYIESVEIAIQKVLTFHIKTKLLYTTLKILMEKKNRMEEKKQNKR